MDQMLFPTPLQPGDKISIVSPSGKIDKALLAGTRECLKSWGLNPVMGRHAGSASGTYAGTVRNRVGDFQAAMNDEKVRAIFCSRGGYGAVHLIDKLDFTQFAQSPKWLIGFSDITALHCLFQQRGYASIHAPMGRHLSVEAEDDLSSLYLKEMLFGNYPSYKVKPHKLNRGGCVKGILRGGNLSVYNGLRGTPYDIPSENTVLFIEDVGERPHCVERIIYNLKLGGVLDKLAGMIIGQFTEYEEDKSLGKELYGALAYILKEYDFPVSFGFPTGHVTYNLPMICGAEVTFEVSKKEVKLAYNA